VQPRAAESARAVAQAAERLRAGEAVAFLHDLPKSAHLIASARSVTAEALELLVGRSRSVLRAAMTVERMRELGLAVLSTSATDGRRYAAAVDAVGHDAVGRVADRVATVRALAAAGTGPDGLVTPGHVFPVAADPGGCLVAGQLPEAAYDLDRLAGGPGVGIYADLAEPVPAPPDGETRRRLGSELGVAVVSMRDLIVDRERTSHAVRRIVSAELPTRGGDLRATGYRSNRTGDDYIAFAHGEPAGEAGLPVYVHFRCPVSDVFGGLACGCGERLIEALDTIRRRGAGLVLYADRQSGKHLGHLLPPPEPPARPGRVVRASPEREVADVLRSLGVASIAVSSNEPLDMDLLAALGIEIDGRAAAGAAA
jgi:3,4-dihydroxy 2-butanone 4-phosphate synthase/GTP cyclohydrolase II